MLQGNKRLGVVALVLALAACTKSDGQPDAEPAANNRADAEFADTDFKAYHATIVDKWIKGGISREEVAAIRNRKSAEIGYVAGVNIEPPTLIDESVRTMLQPKGINDLLVLEFTVNPLGRVDPGSVTALMGGENGEATQQLTEQIEAKLRYRPSLVDGKVVAVKGVRFGIDISTMASRFPRANIMRLYSHNEVDELVESGAIAVREPYPLRQMLASCPDSVVRSGKAAIVSVYFDINKKGEVVPGSVKPYEEGVPENWRHIKQMVGWFLYLPRLQYREATEAAGQTISFLFEPNGRSQSACSTRFSLADPATLPPATD